MRSWHFWSTVSPKLTITCQIAALVHFRSLSAILVQIRSKILDQKRTCKANPTHDTEPLRKLFWTKNWILRIGPVHERNSSSENIKFRFLNGQQCKLTDCMYLHEVAEEEASFTKDDMSKAGFTVNNPLPGTFPFLGLGSPNWA